MRLGNRPFSRSFSRNGKIVITAEGLEKLKNNTFRFGPTYSKVQAEKKSKEMKQFFKAIIKSTLLNSNNNNNDNDSEGGNLHEKLSLKKRLLRESSH